MASCMYILDRKGSPLIYRTYRGDVTQNVTEVFRQRVLDADELTVTPCFEHEGHTYVYIRHNTLFVLTVSKVNCIPALQVSFMRKMLDVFQTYFENVTEESIKDNFVIIYELLDEMVDFGFPQYTEAKILKEYVIQEGYKLKLFEDDDKLDVKDLPSAVTGVNGASQWRPLGIKHRKNEVFLDVIETVNLLLGQNGETIQSEIAGAIKMNVKLSGMPDVKLGLNDKLLFEATGKRAKGRTVEMEDIKFHQCVKLNRFESDRTISFVPPEGEFELMSYRLNTKVKPIVDCDVKVVRHGTSRVEVQVVAKSTYKKTSSAQFVDIVIPVPVDAMSPAAKANNGAVKYQPEKEALIWTIKQFPGGREFKCVCSYQLPSVRSSDVAAFSKRPISVKFEVPYFTVSGFQVRYLKVTEKSGYETFPWVRYVTQSGDYQVRTE